MEASANANPEKIAEKTGMDIKAVMSAAGSLASKDIIEVDKEVEEVISLSDVGLNLFRINFQNVKFLMF